MLTPDEIAELCVKLMLGILLAVAVTSGLIGWGIAKFFN